jgi:hypothetical protein
MMEAMSASFAVRELIQNDPVDFNVDEPYTYENINLPEEYIKPTKEAYDEAFTRHLNIALFKELRQERNRRLGEVDWVFSTDYQIDDTLYKEWLTYRKALRDLPSATEDPKNPVWPEQPAMPSGITTNLSKRQEHLVNDNISMKSKITSLERKTTDQELELIKLKRRLNKLEQPA